MRFALVDVDGCLIQNGILNQNLIRKLKKEQYDHIILFTQRNKFLQVGQIVRSHLMDYQNHKTTDRILTTDDARRALATKMKNHQIRVSTSVDHLICQPLEYFVTELENFETSLNRTLLDDRESIDLQPFNAEVERETELVREALHIEDDTLPAAAFMPKGKVQQYQHLMDHLSKQHSQERLLIDYYDDRADNLFEVFKANTSAIKPNCILVKANYLLVLSEEELLSKTPENFNDDRQFYQYLFKQLFKERALNTKEYIRFGLHFNSKVMSRTIELQVLQKLLDFLDGQPVLGLNAQEKQCLSTSPLFTSLVRDKYFYRLFSDEYLVTSKDDCVYLLRDIGVGVQSFRHISKELASAHMHLQLSLNQYYRIKLKECTLTNTLDSRQHKTKIDLAAKIIQQLKLLERADETYMPPPLALSEDELHLSGRLGMLVNEFQRYQADIFNENYESSPKFD